MAAITKLFGMICALILLIYVAFFAVVNNSIISVTLWPQSPPLQAPLWLITLVAFSSGLLLIGLVSSLRISALRLALYRANKRLNAAEKPDQKTADSAGLLK